MVLLLFVCFLYLRGRPPKSTANSSASFSDSKQALFCGGGWVDIRTRVPEERVAPGWPGLSLAFLPGWVACCRASPFGHLWGLVTYLRVCLCPCLFPQTCLQAGVGYRNTFNCIGMVYKRESVSALGRAGGGCLPGSPTDWGPGHTPTPAQQA